MMFLIQAVTQFLFAALGLVMLIAVAGDTTVIWIAATGLAVMIPMLAGFYLVQRLSGVRAGYLAPLTGVRVWAQVHTPNAKPELLAG